MNDTMEGGGGGSCDPPLQQQVPDAENSAKPRRLPRSQKKKIAREQYRQKRKLKRREKRISAREQASIERKQMLCAMTEEERRAFIECERESKTQLQQQQEVFLQDAYENGLPICINCTFHDSMDERELKSLAKQISVVYSEIKYQRAKIKLSITGIHSESQLYTNLQIFNVDKWKIHMYQENFWEVYDSESIIVLSPDAEEFIEELELDKVYIIGGLVDKHVKKMTTLVQAQHHGLATRALPIQKYFPECKKRILNINAVVDILVMRANNSTWEHAFQTCLPTRAKCETVVE